MTLSYTIGQERSMVLFDLFENISIKQKSLPEVDLL